MTALRSFGFAERRILFPIMSIAAALAVVVGLFSLVGRPWAYDQLYRLEVEAEATSDLDRIKPGRFYFYDEDARTVFIEDVEAAGNRITGLFIRTLDGDDVEIISAPEGTVREFVTETNHELDLQDAQIYKRTDSGSGFLGLFKQLRILVPVGAVQRVGYKPKAQNSFVLRESDAPVDQAEYQWRMSTPISTMLLALLAVPLARSRPRQGRFARLTLAVVIYAVYFNALGISRTWVEQGTASTLWWVPLTLAAAIGLAYMPWSRIASRVRFSR
jgi:lipopolysaccharide export system permease protein